MIWKLRNMGIEAEISYYMSNRVYFGTSGLLIKSEVDNKGTWNKQEVYNASPSKMVSYIGYQIKKLELQIPAFTKLQT